MALAVAWVLVGVSCLHAQQSKPTEYQVKAAYALQFRQVRQNGRLTCGRQGGLLPRLCARPGSFWLDSRFNLAGEALEGKPVVDSADRQAARRTGLPNPVR